MVSSENKDLEQLEREIDSLRRQREQHVTRLFGFLIELVIYFAVPAVGAVLIGKRLAFTLPGIVALMLGAFTVSWLLVILRYRKIHARMHQFDTDIRDKRDHLKREQERQEATTGDH